MSDHAALLRRAATKARETAEAAPRGPYTFKLTPGYHQPIYADDGDVIGTIRPWAGGIADDTGSAEQTGAHITLWHPGVALAVADLLESEATHHADDPSFERGSDPLCDTWPHAVGIARALLGEDTE